MEAARRPKGLFLSKRKYALEIVDECGLLGEKPIAFPMEENHKLGPTTTLVLDDPTDAVAWWKD